MIVCSAEVEKHRLVQRQADSYSLDEIHALFQQYGIKGQEGHELSKPFDFNLMFEVCTFSVKHFCSSSFKSFSRVHFPLFSAADMPPDSHRPRGHVRRLPAPRDRPGALRELPPLAGVQRQAHAICRRAGLPLARPFACSASEPLSLG
jgi:hypothetical protein